MKIQHPVILALTISLSLGGSLFWLFQDKGFSKQTYSDNLEASLKESLKHSKNLLSQSHPLQAFETLQSIQYKVYQVPKYEKEWLSLLLEATIDLKNDRLLYSLYEYRPTLFDDKEQEALLVATEALLKQNFDMIDTLQQKWKNESIHPHAWTLLEADKLAIQNKPEAAIELLNNKTFYGDFEVNRLLRLALLNEKEHPRISWEYLTKALRSAPFTSDLHYYRGKLLEGTHNRDLALLEMKEAIHKNQNDPFYKEEVVKEHLKHKELKEAYLLLNESLSSKTAPLSDELLIKALFLDKIYKPLTIDLTKVKVPDEKMTPFIRYLLALKPGEVWNPSLLHQQPTTLQLKENLVEALWLETIFDLKIGNEAIALKRLQTHEDMREFSKELYDGLLIVINQRSPQLALLPKERSPLNGRIHPLFKQLENPPYSKELENLLLSPESYSALFLAAGWNEAALYLHQMDYIAADLPSWITFGLTHAYASNRGKEKALNFAKAQQQTPQLTLLIAELMIQNNEQDGAIALLTPLSVAPKDVGLKAAKLLSSIYLKQDLLEKAESVVQKNPLYSNSIDGQEQLARIAIKAGNRASAEKILNNIVSDSIEAKSYFAKKALISKEYEKALKLTEELLERLPHNKELKAQYFEITEAMKSS